MHFYLKKKNPFAVLMVMNIYWYVYLHNIFRCIAASKNRFSIRIGGWHIGVPLLYSNGNGDAVAIAVVNTLKGYLYTVPKHETHAHLFIIEIVARYDLVRIWNLKLLVGGPIILALVNRKLFNTIRRKECSVSLDGLRAPAVPFFWGPTRKIKW